MPGRGSQCRDETSVQLSRYLPTPTGILQGLCPLLAPASEEAGRLKPANDISHASHTRSGSTTQESHLFINKTFVVTSNMRLGQDDTC